MFTMPEPFDTILNVATFVCVLAVFFVIIAFSSALDVCCVD